VCSRDDDDFDSSLAHSSEMGQSSVTCGRGTARRDSASQQPDSSKEWMFQGNVAVPNLSEVDWDNDNDRVPDEVRKRFPAVGEELKASFSENAPAEIEYIVIVSDIEKVSCEMYQNEKMLGVPVRGYVATSRRVNRKEWEDSIRWCSTELEHLTWTKISGGIRCWDQFIYDREDVNDPKSTVGVLAMWGTRSYFDARGYAWEFHGTLELPSRAAEHSDILQMATEAFYAAAGLPKEWPRDITFLAVHCEIAEVMCADPARARAIRIPIRGFLQAPFSRCYKWETWLPKSSAPSWDWNPLRGGLCGNEEFESASTEAKSEGSGWIEIIVEGKLGKNNAGRLADAKQARAAHHSSGCSSDPHRVRTLRGSLELRPFRQARSASASSSSTSNSSSATANSAEGKDGVKRRRKGPGSASSPSVASAQGRRRQRPEMVSSMINFSGPLGPLPPAPPGCCSLTLSIIITFARSFSLSHESPRHENC